MAAAPYVPPKDADFALWADNFATLITANPSTYGLDAIAAAAIQAENDAFQAAFTLATNPGTRTPVTVAAKDSARITCQALMRVYASQIRINPGVLNSDKIDLGLNLPNPIPSPIPVPTSFPVLSLVQAAPLTHQFKYQDSVLAVGKAKAPGALQMELRAFIGVAAGTDPETFVTKQWATKSPFLVVWDAGDAGKLATYACRWVTRRGLAGPWSALSTFTVLSGS
jgi:hypothetical protein